jgi:hypothetical protein
VKKKVETLPKVDSYRHPPCLCGMSTSARKEYHPWNRFASVNDLSVNYVKQNYGLSFTSHREQSLFHHNWNCAWVLKRAFAFFPSNFNLSVSV